MSRVVIYSKRMCQNCEKLKNWFNENDLSYKEIKALMAD